MRPLSQAPRLEKSGIGLRTPHIQELLKLDDTTTIQPTDIGFVEAHSENYFGGGKHPKILKQIAEMYPVTLHGVGLSLGRADGLDKEHLANIAALAKDINPVFISEHLTWSGYSHTHVPDLLPIPFTNEAMDVFAAHVNDFQNAVGRPILVENPSNYLAFADLDYTEPEFLNELVDKTGCGLLMDINNIAVSANNLGYDPVDYIDGIVADGRVKQFHLAGYDVQTLPNGEEMFLDTHGKPVYPEVWKLYEYALERFGDVNTLIEWDMDIPALPVLFAEAEKANVVRERIRTGDAPKMSRTEALSAMPNQMQI